MVASCSTQLLIYLLQGPRWFRFSCGSLRYPIKHNTYFTPQQNMQTRCTALRLQLKLSLAKGESAHPGAAPVQA